MHLKADCASHFGTVQDESKGRCMAMIGRLEMLHLSYSHSPGLALNGGGESVRTGFCFSS